MASPVFGQGYVPNTGAITTELSAVTRRAFVPKVVVQLYKAAPLLSLAMRNAQRARGGLSQVSVPIQNASFVNFNWTDYSGGFPIPSVQTALQTAAWNLSIGVVPVSLLGTESLTQSTEAVIPIVKARMNDLKTVAVQSIATALFSSSAGNALAINGLPDAYDSGTTVSTYGGISRSSVPQWGAQVYSTSFAPTRSTMLKRLQQCTYGAGGESPDFVVMSMGDWSTLMDDFLTLERYNTDPTSRYGSDDAVNSGFRCVTLGGVPILGDPFCPAGTAYMINSKYLGLYISEDANFSMSDWYSLIPNAQIASVAVMIVAMALACTKPVSGMKLTALTGAAF